MGRPYQNEEMVWVECRLQGGWNDGWERLWVVPRGYVFTRSLGAPLYIKSDLCRKQFPGAPLLEIKGNPLRTRAHMHLTILFYGTFTVFLVIFSLRSLLRWTLLFPHFMSVIVS